MRILARRLRPEARLPEYQTSGAVGMDLYACLASDYAPLPVYPGAQALIWTGIVLEIPIGYEGQIRPRSGLAADHGVTVLNAPGTIDSDFRGEIGVILINHSARRFDVRHGDRIAQLVIAPVVHVELAESAELGETARGAGGFGSTGVK